ncbi:MAG: phage minor capsid protein [Clostridia bacterium]|nr:phage minor capsid protein [Clostridia bacterium]
MITPEWLDKLTENLEVHKQLQDSILKDIVRRIAKTDFTITESAKWQIEKLNAAGKCYEDIVRDVKAAFPEMEKEIQKAFEDAGAEVFNYSDSVLENAGYVPEEFRKLSAAMRNVLQAAATKTFGEVKNLVGTTASIGQNTFISACELAHQQIVSGAFSYTQAIANAVKQAAPKSGYVQYPSGARTTVETAVRRAVMTGTNQTGARLQEMRLDETGHDLVEVTAHFGARPSHAEWQGGVYSRSGKHPDYDSFEVTGYGTIEGLCGVNCNHGFYMYFEGSKRNYTDEELKKMRDAAVEVDGKQVPVYKAIQKQRAFERSVKDEKRKCVGLAELAKASGDRRYNSDFDRASARLKQKEAQLDAWCRKTGLTKEPSRTSVYGFDRSVSSMAVQGNKRELAKYTKYLYNKDGTVYVTDKMSKTVLKYKPFAVVDVPRKGGGIDRNIYDEKGYQIKQVSNHNHGNPKMHPFGNNGEHYHDYVWIDEKANRSEAKELTDLEKKEHGDLL